MSNTQSTRRTVLGALAGAAVALPALALVSSIPTVASESEDPALIALGEQIEPLRVAYLAAVQRKNEALALAQSLCPPLPEELVVTFDNFDGLRGCCEQPEA